jgi:hypothetical protein
MSPHAILVQPQGRLSIGVAAAFLLSACSHSTFNDSAFSPNTGVLARAPHTAGRCLALGPLGEPPGHGRLTPIVLSAGYRAESNPLRIVGPDGAVVAQLGQMIFGEAIREVAPKRFPCGPAGTRVLVFHGPITPATATARMGK